MAVGVLPEYLDAVAATPRTIDVATQVPHAALRAYVLGERAHEDATDDEVAEMAKLVERPSVQGRSASRRRGRSCTARSTAWCRGPRHQTTSSWPSVTR